jgi:hypothetical protein
VDSVHRPAFVSVPHTVSARTRIIDPTSGDVVLGRSPFVIDRPRCRAALFPLDDGGSMIGSPLAQQQQPGSTRDAQDRPSFVASHRALAVCTREFGRLAGEVALGLTALNVAGELEKALVVQSPGRCIAQVGPVALTMTWLRSRLDVVADGELLVVVWHGNVAPPSARFRERVMKGPASGTTGAGPSAQALWEEVLSVTADSEESWRWQPTGASKTADAASTSYTSTALAALSVERLRVAYAKYHTEA